MAIRANHDFTHLTDDLVRAVEMWSSRSNDELLDALTTEKPVLLDDKGWRQDSRPIRPTVESIQAQFDRWSEAKDAALKSVCDSFCARRTGFSGDSAQMACVLLDAFLMNNFHTVWPYASLAVFVVRNGVMDRVCKCPGDPY